MPSNSNRSIGISKIILFFIITPANKVQSTAFPYLQLMVHPTQARSVLVTAVFPLNNTALPSWSSQYSFRYPGIFLACAEINKHRLNRALGIKEKENAEEVSQLCQTNEALRGIDAFTGEGQSAQNPPVTEGQDCYRVLYYLSIASYINCVLL